ncbi:MAG: glycosyltransferase, partial [Planctomycetes bacterium]|nr:glycosyltransferase [Planctomycetota bacterium]
AFDLVVVPSKREGFPLAVFEACSAGVPAVGYDVPGVRDAILAAGGTIVPEAGGPSALARAAAAIRGAVPRRELVETCDPRRIAGCLVELYESILRR